MGITPMAYCGYSSELGSSYKVMLSRAYAAQRQDTEIAERSFVQASGLDGGACCSPCPHMGALTLFSGSLNRRNENLLTPYGIKCHSMIGDRLFCWYWSEGAVCDMTRA